MAVTREDLEQNRLRAALGDSPVASSLLTEAALEASLASTLARLSSSPCECQDAWVFGYGSLIWNPMIFHTEAAPATVHGYHRGFYLYSRINRGTWDNPGLVLGLDRGGSCRGVAFRVPRDHAEHEFRVLWRREMLTGAYQPRWLPTEINGKRVFALAFVMNRAHEAYAGRLPDERVVGCLRDAVVVLGAFVWQESRAAEPIIPLSMFRVRTVTICCLALFLCFFQLIATSVLMPLRFQMVAGASPDAAALRLVPLTLSIPLGAFLAGKWMTHSGRYKPLMIAGACVVPFAVASLGLLDPHSVLPLTLAMIVLGLAIGVQFPTGLVATQNAVPPETVGLATALTAFSRLLGGAVGVAVLTSVLIALLRQAAPEAQVAAGGDLLMDLFHAALASNSANAQALQREGETAFRHLFFFAAAVSVIAPLLLVRLEEKALRGKVSVAHAVVD